MAEKHIRGELLVFGATPKDEAGVSVTPSTVKLYLNYKHIDATTAVTDDPITMEQDTGGHYTAQFDTKVCEAGALFWSIRTTSPAAAQDGKITIVANAANPDP